MTVYLRQIQHYGVFGGNQIPNIMAVRTRLGVDSRVSSCEFDIPFLPGGLTYDSVVVINQGVVNSNVIQRFIGIVRDFRYKLSPRNITVVCYGYLKRAMEYENWEDPTVIGGLIPMDLTTSGNIVNTTPQGYTDTASNIISAVLDKCNVPHNAANIDSSDIQFGLFEEEFVWKNGTNSENFDLREAGESGLSYIERYDEVDGDGSGRYRTYEDPVHDNGGGTFRKQIQFPVPSGADLQLTETVDILDGELTRSISDTRNYFVVTGRDSGGGVGPEFFVLQAANSFQPGNTKHTYHLNSSMIERSLDADPGTGQSCETLASAVAAEFNREIVTGWVETFRDDPIGPLTIVLVSGNGGQADRLGTGQNLYVMGLEIVTDSTGFTQRLQCLG